jgi:hypothetical protein
LSKPSSFPPVPSRPLRHAPSSSSSPAAAAAASSSSSDPFTRPPGRWCPEETAGPVSRLLFTWIDPLIQIGMRKPLVHEDLWDIHKDDEAEAVATRFDAAYKGTVTTSGPNPHPKGDLLLAMWRAFGSPFSYAGLLKLLHDCLMLMGPILLRRLLQALQSGAPQRTCFFYASSIFFAASLQTLIVNNYFHRLFRVSLHMKISLIHLLFQKSLRITSAVKSGLGVGPIVNLQSNDASKLWNVIPYLHVIWSAPFQILVVLVLLINVVHFVPGECAPPRRSAASAPPPSLLFSAFIFFFFQKLPWLFALTEMYLFLLLNFVHELQ